MAYDKHLKSVNHYHLQFLLDSWVLPSGILISTDLLFYRLTGNPFPLSIFSPFQISQRCGNFYRLYRNMCPFNSGLKLDNMVICILQGITCQIYSHKVLFISSYYLSNVYVIYSDIPSFIILCFFLLISFVRSLSILLNFQRSSFGLLIFFSFFVLFCLLLNFTF